MIWHQACEHVCRLQVSEVGKQAYTFYQGRTYDCRQFLLTDLFCNVIHRLISKHLSDFMYIEEAAWVHDGMSKGLTHSFSRTETN